MHAKILSALVLATAATAVAQTPSPMTAPRARWVLTPGVTGAPTQRRDNPGAASLDRLYLFGGRDANANSTVHNALYEFDGTTWTLRTADTAAAGFPVARGGACVAWDPVRSKLVVFGGDTGTGPVGGPVVPVTLLGDTWEWDPTTNAWTDVTPVSGSPSPRRFASMAFDPTLGGMLLFGGDVNTAAGSPPSGETWVFLSGAWAQLLPATTPPARRLHNLVTRTAPYNDVFLCGGDDYSASPDIRHLDTWRWNGSDWVNLTNPVFPGGTFPHGTTANQAVYDPIRQKIVLQGGQGISTINAPETTSLYGTTWSGSPSTWCSEFDCTTNTWSLFGGALFSTNDPVIGRTSRYFAGFLASTGKVYKAGGQNSSGTGTVFGTCQYQATPVASTSATAPLCTGAGGLMTLTADNLPWLGANFVMQATGMAAASYNLGYAGFATTSIPINSVLPQGIPGCLVLQTLDLEFFVGIGASATWTIGVPSDNALAGLVAHMQYASAEFDPFLNITAIGSSNLVDIVLGRRE